ncbi:methyltransferase domain-containing protein [Nocardiopsis sp. CC223A]|uniref:methyltransferase domain-containing protein n=1 Tax=Nocardiopsis sp. CC223A TaxID=3044051 RepID=UPI00278C2AC2|nr:methyltransferase domain-containing protein [Nocardiopsis sp. CC223A]
MTDDLETLHAALVDRLDTTDAIRAAFAAHPRHRFIPDLVWPDALSPPLHRTSDPERWTRLVYGGDAVTTQANDGGAGPRNEPSSSSSAPQVMADMINAAGVGPGMRVLEIGTGTGWNAAILASLVGPTGHVTSVEIDPRIAALARERLTGAGVTVRTAADPPSGEVFDAVIATCAVTRVPGPWLEAVAEGGRLVLPWSPHPAAHSTPIVALTRSGKSASGPFVREAAFMRDRTQRPGGLRFPGLGERPVPMGRFPVGSVELIGSGMMTQLLLMTPGRRLGTGVRPFQGGHGRIVWMGDGEAWAYVWPDGTVTGDGESSLARDLAAAYRSLLDAGLPALDTFSLEAAQDGDFCRVTSTEIGRHWDHPVEL